MPTRTLKIFFDGGCRPNPGRMETAVAAAGQCFVIRDAGHGCSLTAEWLALLAALHHARAIPVADAVILGDSLAVIDRMRGALPPGAALPWVEQARALAGPGVRFRYVRRTQNLAGIALARLDRRAVAPA